jgi:hypothetical protein
MIFLNDIKGKRCDKCNIKLILFWETIECMTDRNLIANTLEMHLCTTLAQETSLKWETADGLSIFGNQGNVSGIQSPRRFLVLKKYFIAQITLLATISQQCLKIMELKPSDPPQVSEFKENNADFISSSVTRVTRLEAWWSKGVGSGIVNKGEGQVYMDC